MKTHKHKHKTPVMWLEDGPVDQASFVDFNQALAGTHLQVMEQSFEFLSDLTSASQDPAGLAGTGINPGLTNVRQQLLQGRGGQWRLMRCVGTWTIAMQQVAQYTGGSNPAAAFSVARVSMGLCLMKVDDDNNEEDTDSWHLGRTEGVETLEGKSLRMAGQRSSWIWKRTWYLQNFMAGNTLQGGAGAGYTLGDETSSWSETTGASDTYAFGRSCNNRYESALLGAHFDIKRHCTVPVGYKLVWKFHATSTDIDTTTDHRAGFKLIGDYRSLIARPGRSPKATVQR